METFHIMNYIRPICYTALAIGVIAILFKRMQKRTVTYREIENWAKSVCDEGDICHISILSNMPNEVKASVRKQNGASQILNGYKENSSIFVTITDANNIIKSTNYFMGKALDHELETALSAEVEHRIKF
ncbi:MAG: hypothetical protein HDS71_08860 [Bacteroidales bacterium]|nr:hypothetical protein [Bacteroidales bacterium]MBD5224134.1 hypothetical protein [Bacteroidales bacterium]